MRRDVDREDFEAAISPEVALRRFVAILTILSMLVPLPAAAQQRMSLIRDAETEQAIREFARPIFEVAGINPDSVTIYIVNNATLNAFVAGGQNIFINTGLLMSVESAEQLIGILAHETGHVAGGHLARGSEALEDARTIGLVTTLLGIAAVAAVSLSGGNAQGAGIGLVTGGQLVAERSFLSYSRGAEAAADQAGLRYLESAGISARGLADFLRQLEDQELLPNSRQAEYTRTHPLSRDRIEAIEAFIAQSRFADAPLPDRQSALFDRIQAKLIGYLTPQIALQRFRADATDVASRYGRAIALYRSGRLPDALALMQTLLSEAPNDPYFNEITGQMLLEDGQVAAARGYYERALAALPNEPLILTSLAHAQISSGSDADLAAAVTNLERAVGRDDGRTAFAWYLLAVAYGRSGDLGLAALALAEQAMVTGDYGEAQDQARRALAQLPQGASGWLRAQDLLSVAELLDDE